MIDVDGLRIGFGENVLLQDVSFRVGSGESLALLGRSGSGKTTLLRHMIGLAEPQGGRVLVDGRDPCVLDRGERPPFGVVFQEGALLGSLSLLQNVGLPLEVWTDLGEPARRAAVTTHLELVGLEGLADHSPRELSGGQRRRAAIARALVLEPPLLFFDEPSAGLDPPTARAIDGLMNGIRETLGTTLVFVTHEMDTVFAVAERCIVIDDRKRGIVADGEPERLRDEGPDDVQDFLRRAGRRERT